MGKGYTCWAGNQSTKIQENLRRFIVHLHNQEMAREHITTLKLTLVTDTGRPRSETTPSMRSVQINSSLRKGRGYLSGSGE